MRRSWVLRAVLSYSRKGYSEAVFRQDTETFLRVLENALRHFGGVPTLLNLDPSDLHESNEHSSFEELLSMLEECEC